MESYISEAHRDWHTVYGWNAVCPLDCGVNERYDEGEYLAYLEECELAKQEEYDYAVWVPGMVAVA